MKRAGTRNAFFFKIGLIGSTEEYSAFQGANTPYCRPVYVEVEFQN